jgi:hypothetical protein
LLLLYGVRLRLYVVTAVMIGVCEEAVGGVRPWVVVESVVSKTTWGMESPSK